jgi:hypothetical protein
MDTNVAVQIVKGSGNLISDSSWALIIAALTPTLVALAAYLKAKAVSKQVNEVHLSINSRLDQWLKTEREQGEAHGRVEERKDAAALKNNAQPEDDHSKQPPTKS